MTLDFLCLQIIVNSWTRLPNYIIRYFMARNLNTEPSSRQLETLDYQPERFLEAEHRESHIFGVSKET